MVRNIFVLKDHFGIFHSDKCFVQDGGLVINDFQIVSKLSHQSRAPMISHALSPGTKIGWDLGEKNVLAPL